MHALSAPVFLSSLALASWAAGAIAQDADVGTQPNWVTTLAAQGVNQENTPLGVVPQPTPADPGLVWGVTLGELYTDNLGLASSSKPKHTSFITQVRPFVKAAVGTSRFSGLVDYTLTGYAYSGQSGHDQLAQDLKAQGTLSVLPQHLFVDGSLVYGRQILNNALPTGGGTFYLNNNSVNVGRTTLSPYWVQNLGRVGSMFLRYTYGRVVYNDHGIPADASGNLSGLPNITSNAVQFRLASPQDELWGWNLGYSDQRLTPDSGASIEFATATAGISRQVSPGLRLLADGGKENKYLPDGETVKLGAWFWDVGFEWSNALNHLQLLAGHRFYGHSYQFSWTHTAALLTTTLSYIEHPTNLNQQLLAQSPGEILVTPFGILQFPSLTERRIYLMKRASVAATYEMPRSRLTLTLYDESRKYFLLNYGREKVSNANLAWSFDLGPNTTLTPRVGWQRYQFRNAQVNHDRFAELNLIHQINPRNFGSLRLRNDSRSVYAPLTQANGYRVNVIFVQWTHLF